MNLFCKETIVCGLDIYLQLRLGGKNGHSPGGVRTPT